MIKGDYNWLKDICETHYCPEHPDNTLNVAWDKDQGYIIRCGAGHYPYELREKLSFTRLFNQGVAIPIEIANRIEKRREKMEGKALGFSLRESEDRGTGTALTPVQITALMNWAADVGLRAELGHCCIMYGQPYPTVDGLIYHAKHSDRHCNHFLLYPGAEEKVSLGLEPEDYVVECRVYDGIGRTLANRMGVVRTHELTDMSTKHPEKKRFPIVAEKPLEMAENRAMWDAYNDAFPLGIEEEE